MRRVVQILYRIRRMLLRLLRWRTRGVKVMLFNLQGELLLIRNSYGATHLFVLPGGGIRPFEHPGAAAAREIREEVGIEVERLTLRSIHHSNAEGKRDTVHLFTAFTDEAAQADGVEVEEARFLPLDRLPQAVSAATLRRIEEYEGRRPLDLAW